MFEPENVHTGVGEGGGGTGELNFNHADSTEGAIITMGRRRAERTRHTNFPPRMTAAPGEAEPFGREEENSLVFGDRLIRAKKQTSFYSFFFSLYFASGSNRRQRRLTGHSCGLAYHNSPDFRLTVNAAQSCS